MNQRYESRKEYSLMDVLQYNSTSIKLYSFLLSYL